MRVTRAGLTARALLTLGALLPYWRLLTFGVIFVTDDYFASDIFNGELPARVLAGRMLRSGHWPVWTSQLCSGLPLAGSPMDPIGLAAFTLLPPAPALDLFVIVLVLVAAHGAYGLARRFGADRPSAVLAGIAFAGSGVIACQLKHLAIVSTVVWLPVGLLLIDRAMAGQKRAWSIALFGLVFAEQVLSGFPQSAFICALVYGSFTVFLAGRAWRAGGLTQVPVAALAGLALAVLLGAAAGGVVMLPLSALSSVSDRSEPLSYDWATRLAYWPSNFATFLWPYTNGDISDNTYIGPPFFWEDYGYVGLLTFALAIFAAVRERRRSTIAFTLVMTIVAYLFVLGRATPVYHAAYLLIPGISLFRFPTRFLIVVELGLAILAAAGLTRLRAELQERMRWSPRHAALIAYAICTLTAADLFWHQPRQNPIVPAASWLAAPPTVSAVHADAGNPRTYTPRHRDYHRRTFLLAHGWADVEPYFELRDLLEPNTGGGFWDTPSADCYAGISARWYVDVWSDHNREDSFLSPLSVLDFNQQRLRTHPALMNILRTYGVTHVLSPFPDGDARLQLAAQEPHAFVYRVAGSARVRFVRAATVVPTDRDAARRMLDPSFDPDREIVLEDAPDTLSSRVPASGPIAPVLPPITYEDPGLLTIDADAPSDGFLLLADTFYPGWTATVDGTPTPIYRANISTRGIALPRGRHQIRFAYDPPGFRRGAALTIVSLLVLIGWAACAAVYARRR
jgi:hypothetical protein